MQPYYNKRKHATILWWFAIGTMSYKKKPKQQEVFDSPKKKPKSQENPNSYMQKNPVWSFKRADNNYSKWGLKHSEELYRKVITKLISYEGMTWGDIMRASGGRKHGNNNHYENVADLIKEAQERWLELKLDEYDQVFSLRLDGEDRLYGLLPPDGIFSVIWYDQNHEIYQCKK